MKAIYSSKLYRYSTNKERIMAAIQDPINVELVKQLRSYLDDEYQTDEFLDTGGPSVDVNHDEFKSDMSDSIRDDHPEPPEHSGGHFSAGGGDLDTEMPPEGEEPSEQTEEQPQEEEEVHESIHISGNTIEASECCCCKPLDLDVILGTLNSIADTAGVVRITQKKDDELWIYYADSINLNNVMEAVIHQLEICGYLNLSFNRLARTDNAIVFEILKSQVIAVK